MDPEIENIIKEQIEKLPVEVRNVLADPKLNEKIQNMGKKNGLDIDKAGKLYIEVILVLLGLVYPDDFEEELGASIPNIEDNQLNNTVTDVNREIFNGISEKLKETYELSVKNEEENIRKSLNVKNPTPQQNLDFVLSGGDYSVFAEPNSPSPLTPLHPPYQGETFTSLDKGRSGGVGEGRGEVNSSTPSGKPATPQEGSSKPQMQDLKSQFKI